MALPKISHPVYTFKLPSTGKEVKVRPFLVQEEKILLMAKLGNDPKEMFEAIKQVARNCIISPKKFDLDELCLFDIEYFFLKLRAYSISEDIEIRFYGKEASPCEECKKVKVIHINLHDVEVQRTEGHTNKIELGEGVGVVMKYPKFGEQSIAEIQAMVKDPVVLIKLLIEKIAGCIDYIYDEKQTYSSKDCTKEELVKFVDELPRDSLNKLEKFFDTSPKLRHVIDLSCKKCGNKEEYIIEGLESFFV